MLTERYKTNNLLDADVYHVGHHGSQNGTTAAFLALVSPMMAVISMGPSDYGKKSRQHSMTFYYGHPRKQTIDLLAAKIPYARQKTITVPVADKSRVFRNTRIVKAIYGTAWDGNVKITATPASQFVITPQK